MNNKYVIVVYDHEGRIESLIGPLDSWEDAIESACVGGLNSYEFEIKLLTPVPGLSWLPSAT